MFVGLWNEESTKLEGEAQRTGDISTGRGVQSLCLVDLSTRRDFGLAVSTSELIQSAAEDIQLIVAHRKSINVRRGN